MLSEIKRQVRYRVDAWFRTKLCKLGYHQWSFDYMDVYDRAHLVCDDCEETRTS